MTHGKPALPSPPDDLKPEAQARWLEVYPDLARRGRVDTGKLKTYCQVWARWRQAEAMLEKTGPLVKTARGGAGPSPLLSVSQQAARQIKALEKELGLDAEARAEDDASEKPRQNRSGLFTRPELADAFAVHQQTITKWERDGLPIEIRGSRGRPSYYSLAACVQWRIERELAARGVDTESMSPQTERALLDRRRREDLELRMRVRSGELVEAEAVRAEFTALAAAVKARLRSIPDAIADQVVGASAGGPPAVKTLLLTRIDDALRELARGVTLQPAQETAPTADDDGDDEPPQDRQAAA